MHAGQNCSRYQFECHNVDKPMLSECIAVYDACDGIVQCNDGSDETSCLNQQGLLCVILIAVIASISNPFFCHYFVFMPSSPDTVGKGIMFLGCPIVPFICLVRYYYSFDKIDRELTGNIH